MKRSVFVIEDEPKFMAEIKEALATINPDLDVREFTSLGQLVTWLRDEVERTKKIKQAYASPPAEPAADGTPSTSVPVPTPLEELRIDLLICGLEVTKRQRVFTA